MKRGAQFAGKLLLLAALLGPSAAPGAGIDPQRRVERALESLRAERYSLARVWLEPVLIHPRISRKARAVAWYYQGLSFHLQGLFRSAWGAYQRAIEFDPDNPRVLNALAYLYLSGKGVPADARKAHELYLRAAQQGLAEAQLNAGYLYLSDDGLGRDLGEARRWLGEAAAAGNTVAMFRLGQAYRRSDAEHPADLAEARRWLQKAAAAGSTEAAMALGFMLRTPNAEASDLAEARRNLSIAAEAGQPAAQSALAYMLMTGQGGETDLSGAMTWYRRAAEAGDASAALGLGWMYEQGLGVPADPEKALAWYARSAERGDVNAQLRLGMHYIRTDLPKAIDWLARAAQQDNPRAQNTLAWLLATTADADARDGSLAVVWAERAVEQDPRPAYIDTLAAAYAEAGRFEDAIATQRRAIAALTPGDESLRAEFERRLESYEAKNPWRE